MVLAGCADGGEPAGAPPGGPDPRARATAPSPEAPLLAPGREVVRPLAGGESHPYRLGLEADRYLELVAEQQGIDVRLELFDPGGERLIAVDSPTGATGEERLTAVAVEAGTYRLEVRAGPGESGRYALRIAALRPPTAEDRQRAEGDRQLAQADELRRRGGAESLHRAVAGYQRALAAAVELGDRRRQAQALQRLAWLHRKYLDEQRRAAPYYRQAALLFAELGEVSQQASAVNNLGRVYFDLGEMEQAFACWREALPLWRQAGDRVSEAAVLNNLGLHYLAHGEAQEALDFFDRALTRLRQIDSPLDEARVLRNRGQFYRSLGKDREALDDLGESLAIARRLGDRREQAVTLTAMGQVYRQMGELKRARELLGQALALARELGRKRGVAVALHSLASVEVELGRGGAARRDLEQARSLFQELEAPRDEAAVEERLGWLLAASGRPVEALASLDRAQALFAELDDPAGQASSLLGTARAQRALGRLEAARRGAERALAEIEELRGDVGGQDLRSAYFAHQQDHFDFLIDLLMELNRRQPGVGYDLEAFAASERSRARTLLESLIEAGADPGQEAEPELHARELELERRLVALELQRQELLAGEVTPAQRAAVERRLRRLLRDYHQVRSRVRERLSTSPALPRPLSADQVRHRVLDGETLFLEYDLGPERSFLWAVSVGGVSSYELPARSEIEGSARRAHLLLAASNQREAKGQTALALSALGEMLLGPVAGELASHRRLLIVADGALQYVPFAALPVPGDGSGGVALVVRHEVVSMPSGSALAVLRRRLDDRRPAPAMVAVLADPVFEVTDPRLAGSDPAAGEPGPESGGVKPSAVRGGAGWHFPRLLYSRREAEAILALLPRGGGFKALGFDANRETATSPLLSRYRILHFATHGELDAAHPELSRLVLSRFDAAGRPREGQLFAHEIYRLDLPAELVVLSACRTALGKEVRGEGLVGLTQAFFYAGAARVLVSLWQVDDLATAELMTHFYRFLLGQGLEPAAALRAAQLAVREDARWEAPYYWAGFVLQGDWRRLPEPGR